VSSFEVRPHFEYPPPSDERSVALLQVIENAGEFCARTKVRREVRCLQAGKF
jgi:hypothetical protein